MKGKSKLWLLLLVTLALCCAVVSMASASAVETVADEEALRAAVADPDVTNISLSADIELEDTLVIGRDLTLDLNGYTLSAPERVLLVEKGNFTLDGGEDGKVMETAPKSAPIVVKGSNDPA